MKIVNDVFVFTDMKRDKLFVRDRFRFNVFGSVCIFQSVDCLLKLEA